MFFKPLKERLGYTLVIAIAGLGTAVVTCNERVAAAIAIIALLVVFGIAVRRSGSGSVPQTEQSRRRRGDPLTYAFAWELDDGPVLERAIESLKDHGLEVDGGGSPTADAILKGGSQLRTRLFGGYFVDARQLPVEARLSSSEPEHDGRARVDLLVQDALKVAVRDQALQRQYDKAAEAIRTAVEDGLGEWHPKPAT
jgi:hypothetical protein